MLKQLAQKIEATRRLIDNTRSASFPRFREDGSRVRFLLAVSGGMDSMCMLDLFSRILQAEDYAVAHCNFSLRGEESDGDQTLVETRVAELGAQIYTRRFDTESYACANGISIEMAARDLRYGWFAGLCAEHGFDVVVVAHNANDNAETLMLNLLRGTGLNGLHGMADVADFNVNSNNRNVVLLRPLLEFTRKQIEGYVLANRVPYRHDSSNFESDYKRNKIRNEAFPVFEKINPSFIRTLNREIGYFGEAGGIVEEWCRSQLPSVISEKQGGSGHMAINTVALMAIPHWRYLLYHILSPYGFNHQLLASVESLLTSTRTKSGKRFESDTHVLMVERECLVLKPSADTPVLSQRSDENSGHVQDDNDIMVVRGAGTYEFNGRRFLVEASEYVPGMSLRQPQGVLMMDAEKIRFPFVCRRWRQGDWLIPFGMRGKKKISDLFTDLKYSLLEKESSIMIVDVQADSLAEEQHVAALLGVRMDDRYKVTAATKKIVRMSVLESE